MVPLRVRLIGAGVLLLAGAAVAATAARQVPSARPGQPFTVVTADGRRTLPTTIVGDETMVSLDDLAAIFQLSIREDTLAGGVTLGHKGKSVILTPGQPLASAAGRLVSLPAPPLHDGHRWLVPVEFVSRALSVVYESRIEVRKPSRLILVGSVRAPQEEGAQPAVPEPAAPPYPTIAPPRPATAPPATTLPRNLSAGQPAAGGLRVIVIDPGHGGNDTGVRGPAGTLEKDVTLALARRLTTLVENRLGVRVVLTRDSDQAVSDDDRAAMANNNMGDLFISLHANASARRSASGAEIYYLSTAQAGGELGRAEAGGQTVPTLGGGSRAIEMVPWELAQLRHVDESKALAESIADRFHGRIPMSPRAIQAAPLRVLTGVNMPAVLVEAGFLTNPEEETKLASPAYQAAVAEAVLDGVILFSDRAGKTPVPGSPAAPPEPVRRRP